MSDSGTVFIVDDDEAVRRGLSALLGAKGYRAETFATAEHFLQHAPAAGPACLLVDIRMPGMSGLELQRELKRRGNALPVIVITGYSTEATAIEAINLGVAGYLTKPFRLPRILAATARALGEPVPVAEA